MKYKVKDDIMKVMKANPDKEMTVVEIAKLLNFQAYSMDVHIRQLYAQGKLLRPERGVYKLNPAHQEPSGIVGKSFDKIIVDEAHHFDENEAHRGSVEQQALF